MKLTQYYIYDHLINVYSFAGQFYFFIMDAIIFPGHTLDIFPSTAYMPSILSPISTS